MPAQLPLPPIGNWREHLPYRQAIDLAVVNDSLYVATPYSVFIVNTGSGYMDRLSRLSGLAATGISRIAYNEQKKKLLIAYTNSNIDILDGPDVTNIPDLLRDDTHDDKTILAVFADANSFYLATGLGILVIDPDRYEVKDTWKIGNAGQAVRVNDFITAGGFYYAATEEGLKYLQPGNGNPADFANWQLEAALPASNIDQVILFDGNLLVRTGDNIWIKTGPAWNLFYTSPSTINSIQASANRLFVNTRDGAVGRVTVLEPGGSPYAQLQQADLVRDPRETVQIAGFTWIADGYGGLSRHDGTGFESFRPDSPFGTSSGQTLFHSGTFYATSGSVNENWMGQLNYDGLYIFANGSWENVNRSRFKILDTVPDIISIAIDKREESLWAGSFGGGLLERKKDGTLTLFKQDKLEPAFNNASSYQVTGLAFDKRDNLWIANYGAPHPLAFKTSEGIWGNLSLPFPVAGNPLAQIAIDDNDYKWIIAADGNGLLCFDDAGTPANAADDRWRRLQAGAGNGNLPDPDVLCLARDKNGFIWAGTKNGMVVIQCAAGVFSQTPCEAIWPVVKQGAFAGYLFQGEEVRSIAVDGADRKWVATANGVWLISPEGENVIFRFTEENSPLLSDDVKSISIDGKTGEVFFATAKGICSFRSTATDGREKNEQVLVFPNPVPPGYTGTIGIRGLVNNAVVKITEMDGRLVWQGRANGGQAVWDGRDYKGRKISTGVFIVLVNDDGRTEKAVGKIVFINK